MTAPSTPSLLAAGLLLLSALQASAEPARPLERPSRAAEQIEARRNEERRRAAEVAAAAESRPAPVETTPADPPPPSYSPVFTISGAEACAAASARGYRFFPRGAVNRLDGRNSVAQAHPGLITSQVNGHRLVQMRTPAGWTVLSQNVFYLFADDRGRPRPLAPGWRVRDLQLRGENFQVVSGSPRGARSPFVAVRITGLKHPRDSIVELKTLTLEGPPAATDWKQAFAPSP